MEDNVRKETHVVSVMTDWRNETCAVVRDEKDDRPLLDHIRRPRLTAREKNPRKHQGTEMKALQTKGAKFRAVTKIVRTRHVTFGILPCVKTTILRQDANFGRTCFFRHVEAEEKPSKLSKKGGAKGTVALRVYTIGLCI